MVQRARAFAPALAPTQSRPPPHDKPSENAYAASFWIGSATRGRLSMALVFSGSGPNLISSRCIWSLSSPFALILDAARHRRITGSILAATGPIAAALWWVVQQQCARATNMIYRGANFQLGGCGNAALWCWKRRRSDGRLPLSGGDTRRCSGLFGQFYYRRVRHSRPRLLNFSGTLTIVRGGICGRRLPVYQHGSVRSCDLWRCPLNACEAGQGFMNVRRLRSRLKGGAASFRFCRQRLFARSLLMPRRIRPPPAAITLPPMTKLDIPNGPMPQSVRGRGLPSAGRSCRP